MVIGVIMEFRPHAEGELLHVWQVHFVMDVLQDEEMYIHTHIRTLYNFRVNLTLKSEISHLKIES